MVFWDNKLFTRNRETTLLGFKYFVNWHFLKHRRFPLLNIRALSEKTSLKENPDFLKQQFFPIPEFSDRLRASTTKILALRQKKMTEIHDTPSPSIHENFRYRNFLGHKRVPYTMFFGIVRQQTFDRKSWYFPHWHKIFRKPNCSETQKGYSMKKFGTVRQNDSTEYRDSRPRSYPKTFSILETLSDKEGFLYEIFRHRQTKQFRRKTLI